ncbi:(R,S)-reticuline 7-O-methyltransferase [Senna tora]|uniref:(R,S)-reticuline 7-O-methyltransferase n=1 Tax=Senna tora TaxID=362788 RepID=A0A834TZU8_9FABA|nr:(R,S)-reticuline 7-O-methyltransferase [Senna tora]
MVSDEWCNKKRSTTHYRLLGASSSSSQAAVSLSIGKATLVEVGTIFKAGALALLDHCGLRVGARQSVVQEALLMMGLSSEKLHGGEMMADMFHSGGELFEEDREGLNDVGWEGIDIDDIVTKEASFLKQLLPVILCPFLPSTIVSKQHHVKCKACVFKYPIPFWMQNVIHNDHLPCLLWNRLPAVLQYLDALLARTIPDKDPPMPPPTSTKDWIFKNPSLVQPSQVELLMAMAFEKGRSILGAFSDAVAKIVRGVQMGQVIEGVVELRFLCREDVLANQVTHDSVEEGDVRGGCVRNVVEDCLEGDGTAMAVYNVSYAKLNGGFQSERVHEAKHQLPYCGLSKQFFFLLLLHILERNNSWFGQ